MISQDLYMPREKFGVEGQGQPQRRFPGLGLVNAFMNNTQPSAFAVQEFYNNEDEAGDPTDTESSGEEYNELGEHDAGA